MQALASQDDFERYGLMDVDVASAAQSLVQLANAWFGSIPAEAFQPGVDQAGTRAINACLKQVPPRTSTRTSRTTIRGD